MRAHSQQSTPAHTLRQCPQPHYTTSPHRKNVQQDRVIHQVRVLFTRTHRILLKSSPLSLFPFPDTPAFPDSIVNSKPRFLLLGKFFEFGFRWVDCPPHGLACTPFADFHVVLDCYKLLSKISRDYRFRIEDCQSCHSSSRSMRTMFSSACLLMMRTILFTAVSWSVCLPIMQCVDLLCPRISVQYLQLREKRLVVGLEICAVA